MGDGTTGRPTAESGAVGAVKIGFGAMGALAIGLAVGAPASAQPPPNTPSYLRAALADPGRPAKDTTNDPQRKPAMTLAFAGLRPGQQVADFWPGGGYFTRVMAKAVGPSGHVYDFVPAEITKTERGDPVGSAKALAAAYPNVSVIVKPAAAFGAPVPLDLVFTAQNYHDLHDKFTGPVDVPAFDRAVFAALKPGGVFLVVDHAAPAGSGLSDTETLHRIDEQAVKSEVEAAGFVLDGESDLLRNPADPRTALVFAPSIRGHTDQFILRFRKPG